MTNKINVNILRYSIAFCLFLLTLTILLRTQNEYGLAWDEPYNYNPSAKVWNWVTYSLIHPFSSFTDEKITESWSEIHEHPSLTKFIAAFSYGLSHAWLDDLLAFRLGEFLFYSIFIAVYFLFLSKWISLKAGLFSSLALFLMPRMFGQVHFATTDVPMMIMCFYTVICFYKGLESKTWSLILGVVWGLALATKINALFLPIPLILWAHLYHRDKWGFNVFCMMFLSPIIFILSWPWLWHHTIERIFEYLLFYTGHKPTTVVYFGKLYYLVPAPWHYPLVYTLITIPLVTLFFIILGIWKTKLSPRNLTTTIPALFLFMAVFPILLQSMPGTPRYDGTRLFLNAFPFLAGLAGVGFCFLLQTVQKKWNKSFVFYAGLTISLLPSIYHVWDTHPYQLSYYNYLIGGIGGANAQGLESTYWCEAVNKDVLDYLNNNAPPNSKILFLSFSEEVLQWYQEHHYLRPDLDCLPKDTPDYTVLQCRQGFFARQEWYLYYRVKPVKSFKLHDVPLVNIYHATSPDSSQ